jgi:DNA-binding response OmpR family regulator
MTQRHLVLIVEDDAETASDLQQILLSLDCDSIVADNRTTALAELRKKSFCLVLLDLEIKDMADSIKGHVAHGKALLRNIREKHSDHTGKAYWLPVLVVSGFARERDEALDVMREGAHDVIQKPFETRAVSEVVNQALQASGRLSHDRCHEPPTIHVPNLKEGILIAIPGDRVRRRTRVTVASRNVNLTDASLKLLLHLIVARKNAKPVHKIDLGAKTEQGFKGISNLRNELRPWLGGLDIIDNDYQGHYQLKENVTLGECACDRLLEIGDQTISRLAKELQHHQEAPSKKSEGNSRKFPTHRRRRGE